MTEPTKRLPSHESERKETALRLAIQFVVNNASPDHVVQVAKVFESYLKGE